MLPASVQRLAGEERLATIVDGDVVLDVLLVLEVDAEVGVGRNLERVDVEGDVAGLDLDRGRALAARGRRGRLARLQGRDVGVVVLA